MSYTFNNSNTNLDANILQYVHELLTGCDGLLKKINNPYSKNQFPKSLLFFPYEKLNLNFTFTKCILMLINIGVQQ